MIGNECDRVEHKVTLFSSALPKIKPYGRCEVSLGRLIILHLSFLDSCFPDPLGVIQLSELSTRVGPFIKAHQEASFFGFLGSVFFRKGQGDSNP